MRAYVRETTGIAIGKDRGNMISARLARRLVATGCRDLGAYMDVIETGAAPGERQQLISAMTTNVTHFFREPHHFDRLQVLAEARFRLGRPLCAWSAGCSSGQEAYSLAFTLTQAGYCRTSARVLATDIDRAMLQRAMAADYTAQDGEVLALSERGQAMLRAAPDGRCVPQAAREMVEFKPLNLIEPWPMRTGFDVVFCRNVAIYFAQDTQSRLWQRLISMLNPGGWLFVGHSERLPARLLGRLSYRGQTSYQMSSAWESETAS